MRRRTKRDLMTLTGVAIVLSTIVTGNVYLNLEKGKELYRSLRISKEADLRQEGYTILNWEYFRDTKGSWNRGVSFSQRLKQMDGKLVNLVGFMSPIAQFSKVDNFMLLPVPITCYFCDDPPMRDVVEIELRWPTPDIVNEPVVIAGRLKLHEQKGEEFFYTIEDSLWNEAVKDEAEFTRKQISAEHRAHYIWDAQEKENAKKQLAPLEAGFDPYATKTADAENDALPKMGKTIGGHTPVVDMGELIPAEAIPVVEKESAPTVQ